ncbi:hypothetical protein BJ170DRAFT_685615 [Xylariales sp. AK1849]|nr:hypothetical protein BJ170DRAFT_685615 [Xylariales sp. AK1849]
MERMSRNGDIRGFLRKGAPRSSDPRPPSAPSSEPSPLDLPSSPITPQRNPPKAPRTRDTEIKGSDDDDDDSDDSLESLSEIIGRKIGTTATQRGPGFTTPKAKRVASGVHRSPLTLQQQPKHKFDLKSLVNHARQDDATEESARRGDELLKVMAKRKEEEKNQHDPSKMRPTTEELLGEDDEDGEVDKLTMAMDRTQGDESHPRCYFFNIDEAPRNVPRQPFPKVVAKKKPWSILADAGMREQMFIRGLPTTLALKGKELPDELYRWILDEICVEKNLQLKMQYINLAALCRDDTRRLVNCQQLHYMLQKLGGPKYAMPPDKFELSPGLPNPYPGRDWSSLGYFLELLDRVAPNMTPDNATNAVQMLLRMSLDPIVSSVARVRVQYSQAMLALITALPAPEEQWTTCCEKICNYLYVGVEQASQRSIAINLMPTLSPRLVELQRRLACEALFDNPKLGVKHPDESVTIQDIFRRLSKPDFQVNHSTDFTELNALLTLLDIVIDNGSYLRRAHRKNSSSSPSTPGDDAADTTFNADIDRLNFRLKTMHDKINDNSLISRKEGKAALDGMMKRLTYTVRTRPPPKASLFDPEPKENPNLPKQRDFMKKWAEKQQAGRRGVGGDGVSQLG